MNYAGRALRLLLRTNLALTLSVLALIVIGVLFIYSASYAREEAVVRLLYRKQIFWAVVSLGCYAATALFDYRRLGYGVWGVYGLALILLVAVLLIGTKIYGATRWLMFLGVGVQPSEIAKLALILGLTHLLGRPGARSASLATLVAALALAAIPMVLILKEPDLGTAMVFVPMILTMLYVGGARLKYILLLLAGGILLVGFMISAVILPERLGWSPEKQERLGKWSGLSNYQRSRIMVFLNPGHDPLGAGWNKTQSEITVGSGGLTGKGYLKGTQTSLEFLPRTVAPTDFIFAVITEETGFLGSVAVLGLFGILLFCGMYTALTASDKAGRLLCVGVMAMIFSHVMVNVAMTIGLMPITGLPLPLISYGGTFMLSTLIALGLVQSVYVRRVGE